MTKNKGRVVGLDVHPDSFAGAVVQGRDPASAMVLRTSTRVELERLEEWARRHTCTEDTLVLEASGNAFAVAARLRAIDREVEILDSHHAGKVGKVYCANDRVDAVKIARIYLSALSPIVWHTDQKTLERREIFSAYQAVVKESTRAKQQLRSMLNEHCVRLEKGFRLCHPQAIARLLKLREWTPARRMLLQQLHGSLVAARARRTLLRRHMAQEIVAEEALLRLTRLCGINLITFTGWWRRWVMCVASHRAKSWSPILASTQASHKAATFKAAEHSSGMEEERFAPYSSNRARSSWK